MAAIERPPPTRTRQRQGCRHQDHRLVSRGVPLPQGCALRRRRRRDGGGQDARGRHRDHRGVVRGFRRALQGVRAPPRGLPVLLQGWRPRDRQGVPLRREGRLVDIGAKAAALCPGSEASLAQARNVSTSHALHLCFRVVGEARARAGTASRAFSERPRRGGFTSRKSSSWIALLREKRALCARRLTDTAASPPPNAGRRGFRHRRGVRV